ncbi:hypothetical protein GW17_00043029, partial [Ensete ventricosum]
ENRCQFGRAAAVEVAAEMFTNDKRQAERTGRHGTPRAQYLQVLSFSLLLRFELVTEFQNTTNEGHYWFFVIIVLLMRTQVTYALGALYYLCNSSSKKEILKPEVIEVIRRYSASGSLNVIFSNLANAFLDKHVNN